MKKLAASVGFRLALLAVSVVLQATAIIFAFAVFREHIGAFYTICILVTIVAVVHIILKDSDPSFKIAWLIPIMLLPIFGGLFYAMFGRSAISKKQRRDLELMVKKYESAGRDVDAGALSALESENPQAAMQARYLRDTAGAPLFSGADAEYFPLGEDMWKKMLDELEKAEKFIFLEYFIIQPGKMWDPILEILKRKAAAGVDVRLLYDDFGCLLLLPADYPDMLRRYGIKCLVFNRFSHIFNNSFNTRNHRKICVIDGNVGFTGGINLSDEYINAYPRFGHWKDTGVMLRGEPVYGLTSMFLALWGFLTGKSESYYSFRPTVKAEGRGFVQPFTDIPTDSEAVGEIMYTNMLSRAVKYVHIMTPYLIIDSEMTSALVAAAKSGVDVRIITPGVPDKKLVFFLSRSYYEKLLKAGVRIFEYTPGFVHAKSFVSDDTTAAVGTINLDYRSLYLHFECAVWMYGTNAAADVERDFLETQAKSREITLENGHKLRALQRALLCILRIFAPLM